MSLSRRALLVLPALLLIGCPVEIPIPVDPPEARLDYAQTPLDTPVTLSPLLNDYDPTAELLTVVSIGTPSHGVATLNPSGTIDYTPDLGYLGGDSFAVTITDASGNQATNTAHVTVGPSARTVYRSNWTDYFTNQLYMSDAAHPQTMVPVSVRIPITQGPVLSRQQVTAYIPSADGVNMIYTADTDPSRSVADLFHVDLRQPGIGTKLTTIEDGQAIGGLSLPQLAPDGLHAYYLSNEFNSALFEVVQVEIANPTNLVRVNTPLDTDDIIERFSLSLDGAYMLYVARDQDATPTLAENKLHVVDLSNPGVSTVLSANATTGTLGVAGSLGALGFRFIPGTTKVVYAAQANGATTIDLYIVDYVAMTPPQKLSSTALGTGVLNFGFTPDGSRVLYVSAEDLATVLDLYMVDPNVPGVPTRLSRLRTGTASIATFSVGMDNTFALYVRDDDVAGQRELYFVEFANPTVQVKLNHVLRPGTTTTAPEVVLGIRVSPGAPRVVLYSTSDDPVNGVFHQTMRTVDVDALGTTNIVGPSTYIGHSYGWLADGDSIIYQDSPPESVQATSLYHVRISAPTVYTRLSNEDHGGDAAVEFSFLP